MRDTEQFAPSLYELALAYMIAKQTVIEAGYAFEVDWQERLVFDQITEFDFLSEAAWVVLSSGMCESVIRKKFPRVSAAFFEWESAQKIAEYSAVCSKVALCHFNHSKKIGAIIQIAVHVFERGFDLVREGIKQEGVNYIAKLPYMGPATSQHLAKNIGLQVAKPDRHLNRISQKAGYCTPHKMCGDIAEIIGEKLSVVDLVLWRYATLRKDYLDLFPESVNNSRQY